MEPEIIELNVQRAGMEKIGLRAVLIDLSQDVRRLVIAWPVGNRHEQRRDARSAGNEVRKHRLSARQESEKFHR